MNKFLLGAQAKKRFYGQETSSNLSKEFNMFSGIPCPVTVPRLGGDVYLATDALQAFKQVVPTFS